MKKPPLSWYKNRYRVIGVILTLLFIILWLLLGFTRALLVSVVTAIGFLIGAYFDGELDLNSWFNFFMR